MKPEKQEEDRLLKDFLPQKVRRNRGIPTLDHEVSMPQMTIWGLQKHLGLTVFSKNLRFR